ncbi:carbohydrate ABC transporter permease [Microlunatus parietis]|uniref:Multiple sugar transport system permease protein n=1 Tax=Microlunatus parietis TaxID=682979 RepID=A0A7Y9IBE6_9ACTN|nr:sugar ABC transporter permease [Microlunatus parietis]NYE73476.1 multiple sugar transport system permease protein [Microlunatus parietis]
MSVLLTAAPPAESEPAGRPRRRFRPALREDLAGYAFLTPWLVGFFGITLLPMLGSLLLSFTNYSGSFRTVRWVGLENYRRMFVEDPAYWGSVRVTLLYVGISVPVMLAFALLIASLLNRGIRALGLYRTIFYVPSLLGGSVAIAVLWRFVWGETGLINAVLGWFGLFPGSWIGNPDTALITIMVLNVWTFGSPMIIFLAGLRQVPAELYEAAAIDGAGRWARFASITLPSISPVVLFNGVLAVIGGFQAFTQVYVVSGGSGGPAGSTLFYTLLLYQRAFTELRFGYASAMAWTLLIVIAAVTAAIFASGRFWVYYGDEA